MGQYSIPCNESSSSAVLERRPLVSVAMITYNHEPFIARAIEGVLRQRTDFPFELVIGEDASTDATREICQHYQRRYPDVIRILWASENVSRDCSGNFYRTCQKCRGKYVALCEGDDYWTDPDKLQLQVDYLEEHPECAICFHPVRVVWTDGIHPDGFLPKHPERYVRRILGLRELLSGNFISTNSVVYRWNADGRVLTDFPVYELPGDWMLSLLHARMGNIGFINRCMAVYNRHGNGLWAGDWISEDWFRRVGVRVALFYKMVEERFHVCRKHILIPLILATVGVTAKDCSKEDVRKILTLYCPLPLWVWCAPIIATVGMVMIKLAPPSIRPPLSRRFEMWRIIWNRHRDIQNKLRRYKRG